MGATEEDSEAEDDERPQHVVYLDAFWIDQTVVTNQMILVEPLEATRFEQIGWRLAAQMVFLGMSTAVCSRPQEAIHGRHRSFLVTSRRNYCRNHTQFLQQRLTISK